MEYPFEEGVVVAATRTITENGKPPGDPNAAFPHGQYIHARMGDVGIVVCVDDPSAKGKDPIPTVDFLNSGTATIVGKDEVIFVAPTMEEYKAGHEEWCQRQADIQKLEESSKPKDLAEAIISMVTDECRCPDPCPVHDHHPFRMEPLPKGTTFSEAYPDGQPSLGPGGVCHVCGAETEMVPRESLPERLKLHLGAEKYLWCPQCVNLSMYPRPQPGPRFSSISMGAVVPEPRCMLCEAGVPQKRFNIQQSGTLTGELIPNEGVLECWNCGHANDIPTLYADSRTFNTLRCLECHARVAGFNHLANGWCRVEDDRIRRIKRALEKSGLGPVEVQLFPQPPCCIIGCMERGTHELEDGRFLCETHKDEDPGGQEVTGANFMIQSEFAARAMRGLYELLSPEQQEEFDATGCVTLTEEAMREATFSRKVPFLKADYGELELRVAAELAKGDPCVGCENYPGMMRGQTCEGCEHWAMVRAMNEHKKVTATVTFNPSFKVTTEQLVEATERGAELKELIDKQISEKSLEAYAQFVWESIMKQRRDWKALNFDKIYGSPPWAIFDNYKEAARRSPEAWREEDKSEEAESEEEATPKQNGSEGSGEES